MAGALEVLRRSARAALLAEVRGVPTAVGLAWCAQTAQAEILFNGKIPASESGPYEIRCEGQLLDVVDFAGELHLLAFLTADSNGGLRLKIQINATGVTGVGQLTGDIYQGVGVTTWESDILHGDGSASDSYVNEFGLVSRATGLNYFMHEVTHLFFEENGEIEVAVEMSNITCR